MLPSKLVHLDDVAVCVEDGCWFWFVGIGVCGMAETDGFHAGAVGLSHLAGLLMDEIEGRVGFATTYVCDVGLGGCYFHSVIGFEFD